MHRARQGCRLVVPRGPHLRDGRRLSAFFRRQPDRDVPEDRRWQAAFPWALQLEADGPSAQLDPRGHDEALRQLEERRRRRQEAQLVRVHRLERHLQEGGGSALHPEVSRTRGCVKLLQL